MGGAWVRVIVMLLWVVGKGNCHVAVELLRLQPGVLHTIDITHSTIVGGTTEVKSIKVR